MIERQGNESGMLLGSMVFLGNCKTSSGPPENVPGVNHHLPALEKRVPYRSWSLLRITHHLEWPIESFQFEWAKLRFQPFQIHCETTLGCMLVVTLSCISCTDVSMCILHRPDSKGKSEMPTGGLSLTTHIEVHRTTWQQYSIYMLCIHMYAVVCDGNCTMCTLLFVREFPFRNLFGMSSYWLRPLNVTTETCRVESKMQAELKSTRVGPICSETFEGSTDLPAIKHIFL